MHFFYKRLPTILWVFSIIFFSSVLNAQTTIKSKLTGNVNPFIGSAKHGHVFVGANVPHGAVQLGPSQIMQTWDKFNGWDWCSGYNYDSPEILGFTHTHLSGTGIGDLNDILLLPANGKTQVVRAKFNDMESGYGSFFSKQKEVAKPGYYEVYLDKYKIKAQLTATERIGFHQYTYEKKDNAHLLVDLGFGMGWDEPVETYFKQINATTFEGYRFSKGWAVDQRVYFAIQLSVPVTKAELYNVSALQQGTQATGKEIKAALFFDAEKNAQLKVKVAISPVSASNALLNLKTELPGWDFNVAVQRADAKWEKALSSVRIEASPIQKTKFYTALYHTMIAPSLFNDVNGDYRGADKKVHKKADFNNYTTFSLWDTYRGLNPLMTILQPERVNDIVNSMLAIYQQQGKLPVWHLHGNETNCMIGYPAVPVIVDAYLKGFRNYDVELAYKAIRQSAMQDTNGIQYMQKLKFIPADEVEESVAKAMEYAISDASIAQMAKALGKKDDFKYFTDRSKLYQQYFDKSTGHFRGRMADDSWRTPFNPYNAVHRQNDYCEGNAWQYTWLVPQDVKGLINCFGGTQPFLTKLDSLFTISSKLDAETSPDISGLIGQYAHGNEPNHHIPYLYSMAVQPWKTAEIIRQIDQQFYTDKPDGLCGNDDAGEMSAWYVFSALGFYPVHPTSGEYVFGSPLIDQATIKLPGNKTFRITVMGNSKDNPYIRKIELNHKPYTKSFVTHHTIVAGGEMKIYMGNKPLAY
ncbi:glycoside hydrolase family 92 protein [Pedobacter hiemivivus]|uniref:Glycoside hydrolase family 92 protein n=1 Tax=Pedobacter hiemivivus TaxID=2530454 RepID=A0A4U1GBN5_9SPHI|nr:GH92 family glycosyl hydrolase [Pedobacter hiemivivus]TKC61375.1 glycoside hydrolase family 92 protein [Pedobacter hiemivivus]